MGSILTYALVWMTGPARMVLGCYIMLAMVG